jgi:hypothetical protein
MIPSKGFTLWSSSKGKLLYARYINWDIHNMGYCRYKLTSSTMPGDLVEAK